MNHTAEKIEVTEKQQNFWQRSRGGIVSYLTILRMFSRNARLYLIGSFLMGVNFHIFQLLLNLYLKELGFVESQIGLVISARALGVTLLAIPVAMILSRVKLKPLLLTGCIMMAGFSYFITTMDELFFLMGFSLLTGMSFAFFRVASGPFYMRNSTTVERTHLFSLSFGMMLLAGMVGSLFSGTLVIMLTDFSGDIISGYRYTLYLGIAASILALIPFSMVKANPPSAEESKMSFDLNQIRKRGGFYFKITIANFIVGLGAGLIIPFLNLYFRDRFNQPPDRITFFYFLAHLVMLVGIMIGPIMAKKIGLVRAVVTAQLSSIPFMLILSYSDFLPLVLLAFVLRAGLMNIGVPIITNLAMELSEKSEQGLVSALLIVAWTSALMISSAFGGVIIEHYGYTVTINITIVIYLLSTLIFYSLFKNVETRQNGKQRWTLVREAIS